MQPPTRPPAAWRLLIGLALIKVAVHLLSAAFAWGYMSDELYYLDSIDRLDWGFVDHPPLSIAVLGGVRALLGDSLFAIRVLPALLGGLTVILGGLMAREMGGGRAAQGLAALAVLTNLVHLALDGFYSMNAIDIALWAVAMWLVLRIVADGTHRQWLLLGVIMGAGVLNKASMLWFGAGLGIGLVLTPERRWLRTAWPWTAGVIALGCFAPFVWWQWSNGWPFLEFSRNAAAHKIGHVTPIAFASEQILAMNPVAAPLVAGGLVWCFASESGRRYRAAMWVFVTVFLLLAFSGSARSHYLAPAYPIPLAAGSVALERLARGRAIGDPARGDGPRCGRDRLRAVGHAPSVSRCDGAIPERARDPAARRDPARWDAARASRSTASRRRRARAAGAGLREPGAGRALARRDLDQLFRRDRRRERAGMEIRPAALDRTPQSVRPVGSGRRERRPDDRSARPGSRSRRVVRRVRAARRDRLSVLHGAAPGRSGVPLSRRPAPAPGSLARDEAVRVGRASIRTRARTRRRARRRSRLVLRSE